MVRARVRADSKEICARIRAASLRGDRDARNRFVVILYERLEKSSQSLFVTVYVLSQCSRLRSVHRKMRLQFRLRRYRVWAPPPHNVINAPDFSEFESSSNLPFSNLPFSKTWSSSLFLRFRNLFTSAVTCDGGGRAETVSGVSYTLVVHFLGDKCDQMCGVGAFAGMWGPNCTNKCPCNNGGYHSSRSHGNQ